MRIKYKPNLHELNDLQREELQGPVKQVMQIAYGAYLKTEEVIQSKILIDGDYYNENWLYSFDEKGYKRVEIKYSESSYTRNTFREDRQPLQSETFNEDGRLILSVEHFYKGNDPIETRHCDANGRVSLKTVITYVAPGKQHESIMYSGDKEKVLHRTEYSYDEELRPISCIRYKGNDETDHTTLYKYDEQGKTIYHKSYYSNPEKAANNHWHEYKYNEHGDAIESISYHEDGTVKSVQTHSWEYDAEGKRINPHLKKIKEDEKDEDGDDEQVVTDARGNWIKKTLLHKKVPVHILVRELIYFDEATDRELEHPLSIAEIRSTHTQVKTNLLPDIEKKDAQWLIEQTIGNQDKFSPLRYYVINFNEVPSEKRYFTVGIAAVLLLDQLKKYMNAVEVYSSVTSNLWDNTQEYTVAFRGINGYILYADQIQQHSKELYKIPEALDSPTKGYVELGRIVLLRPAEGSGKRDDDFEEDVEKYIERFTLSKKNDKPTIQIIEVKNGNLALEEYPAYDDFDIQDLDINYGSGFKEFHNNLMQRFATGSKGLVLFHGIPGTGKTFYIRHILRKMAAINKPVICVPSHMVNYLADPSFITFLTQQVKQFARQGKQCMLLIEDAEPLIVKPEGGERIQGVTNLLNMTDGILNDMLNLQVICTYNTDHKKLDGALERPGRLIARKEFKALSVIDANRLAQRIGVKHVFKKRTTISEIYAMQKNGGTLMHDVESREGASTEIDDLA